MKKLTAKQQMFVKEYLRDLNATQAAVRAGYSKKTSNRIGPELLGKTWISDAIQAQMDKRADKIEVNADKVLEEICRLAFADVRKIFDEHGRLLPVHSLPSEISSSISSVKVVTQRIPGTDPVEVEHVAEIKFWDKKGSLELLGKHLKLFTDKVEHSGKVTLEDLVTGK